MRDYDEWLVWLVTAMRVVFSPETGEHKAIIGRQAARRCVVQGGRPGRHKWSGQGGSMAEVTLISDRFAERRTKAGRLGL